MAFFVNAEYYLPITGSNTTAVEKSTILTQEGRRVNRRIKVPIMSVLYEVLNANYTEKFICISVVIMKIQ